MIDYTERFRTLSIGQMQQVLAVLADCVYCGPTHPATVAEFGERITAILAQEDNRTWDQQYAGKAIDDLIEASSLGTPEAKAIHAQAPAEAVARVLDRVNELSASRIIRAAEGVALEPGEYEPMLSEAQISLRVRVPATRKDAAGTLHWAIGAMSITAVRRVEQQPPQQKHTWWCKRGEHDGECNQPPQPSRIIRSGDLEVGKRYRIVEIFDDDAAGHQRGDIVTCAVNAGRYAPPDAGHIDHSQDEELRFGWFAAAPEGRGTYVTAVELVEDEAERDEQNDPDIDLVLVGLRSGADEGDRRHAESAAHRLGARNYNLRANAREQLTKLTKERDELAQEWEAFRVEGSRLVAECKANFLTVCAERDRISSELFVANIELGRLTHVTKERDEALAKVAELRMLRDEALADADMARRSGADNAMARKELASDLKALADGDEVRTHIASAVESVIKELRASLEAVERERDAAQADAREAWSRVPKGGENG